MRVIGHPSELESLVGQELGVSQEFPIDQERVAKFAEATGDDQWIHTDVERAKRESPFHTPIAHGFLTAALFPRLMSTAVVVGGSRLIVNAGTNYVRFPGTVPVGCSIRARLTLKNCERKPRFYQATWILTVERKGALLPCCVAEWVVQYWI